MTDLEIRAALKQRWQNNNHDVDLEAMAKWSGRSREELIAVIRQYESELLVTKFNLK